MAYPSNPNPNSNSSNNGNGNGGGRRDVGFSLAEAVERAAGGRDSSGANGNGNANGQERPYHAEVLPERASPAKTDGFADDAFKPIWERDHSKSNGAFTKSR